MKQVLLWFAGISTGICPVVHHANQVQTDRKKPVVFFVVAVERKATFFNDKGEEKNIGPGFLAPPIPVNEGNRFFTAPKTSYWAVKYYPEKHRWLAKKVGPDQRADKNIPHWRTDADYGRIPIRELSLVPAGDPKGHGGKRHGFLLPLDKANSGSRFTIVATGTREGAKVKVSWDTYGSTKDTSIQVLSLHNGLAMFDLFSGGTASPIREIRKLAKENQLPEVKFPVDLKFEIIGDKRAKPVLVRIENNPRWIDRLTELRPTPDPTADYLNHLMALDQTRIELWGQTGDGTGKANALFLFAREIGKQPRGWDKKNKHWILKNMRDKLLISANWNLNDFNALVSLLKSNTRS